MPLLSLKSYVAGPAQLRSLHAHPSRPLSALRRLSARAHFLPPLTAASACCTCMLRSSSFISASLRACSSSSASVASSVRSSSDCSGGRIGRQKHCAAELRAELRGGRIARRRTPSSSSIASFGRPRRVTVALHSDCIEIGEPFSEYPRSFCPAIRGVSCTRGVNATAAPDEAAGVIGRARRRAGGAPASAAA